MTNTTKSFGLGTSLVINEVDVDLKTQYSGDSFSFSATVSGKGLDMETIAKQRLNDFNLVLPKGSTIPIGKISGTIAKTGTDNKDREITLLGSINNVTIPIPILPDVTIEDAYFYYQYLSKAPTGGGKTDLSGQVISIGCKMKLESSLQSAVTGAKVTGAYFLSNNATLMYLDFAGKINVGKILTAVFGGTFPNLTIDIESAGIFRMTKQNKVEGTSKGGGKQGGKQTPTIPGLTYAEALQQITELQTGVTVPSGNTKSLMPAQFPLANMPKDFAQQFAAAFSETNGDVTGISFWAIIDFSQITLFNSMVTIGYSGQMNNISIYGFRTQTTQQKTGGTSSNSALFASFPTFSLLNIFTFSGNHGRENILFQYTSNKNQYELSGSVAFSPFTINQDNPSFTFDGDLTVNDEKLIADLTLSTGSPTQSVNAPFGMTGINFGTLSLSIDHTFAQTKPKVIKASTDLIINGEIDLTALENNLILSGTIIFEESSPRLALVTLTASPVLTIYDFVMQVVKKPWHWVDDITKAIGLVSGSMYYLKCPKGMSENNCKDYTFDYTPTGGIKKTFKQGYHLDAVLQFFEKYNFEIELDVQSNGIVLSGTYLGTKNTPSDTLKIYFIELTKPTLTINTVGNSTFEVSVQDLKLFGTDIGGLSMGYSQGIFNGSYTIPSTSIKIDWQWTKGDFSITSIDGLGGKEIQDAKAITSLVNKINSMGSGGGCGTLVNQIFNNEVKTNFSISLTSGQKPHQSTSDSSKMVVPLTITTSLTIAGQPVTTIPTNFECEFTIPTSLSDLPTAIWDTVTDPNNLDYIFGELLSHYQTYEAITLIVAKKFGGSAAAKMLCRQNEESSELGEELAETLEGAIDAGEIAGGIGGVLDLSGVAAGIFAAAAVLSVGSFLKNVWNTIKSWFGGASSKKKKEAEDKVNALINKVQPLLANVNNRLNKVKDTIQVKHLYVSIDASGDYLATWDFPDTSSLGNNINLNYQLLFLTGTVNGGSKTSQPGLPKMNFELMNKDSYKQPWKDMRESASDYQMNASIQTSIVGYAFLSEKTKNDLQTVVSKLNSIKSKVDSGTQNRITTFVNTINSFIALGYKSDGLTSTVVYAQWKNKGLIIGQSILGINSEIGQ